MKKLTSLLCTLGILFFAGNKGTFARFDLFLYPMIISSIIFLSYSLLFESKKLEKMAILFNSVAITLYLVLWIVHKIIS